MTLVESQFALTALASLCAGEPRLSRVLRRLVRRVRPTLVASGEGARSQVLATSAGAHDRRRLTPFS